MSEQNASTWSTLKEHLKIAYRVSIKNNESLESIRNFSITNQRLYIYLFSAFCLTSLFVGLLISITPLKRLIPGFGKVNTTSEILLLTKQVDSLEYKIKGQNVYINNLKKVIYGEVETIDDAKAKAEIIPDSLIEEQIALSTNFDEPEEDEGDEEPLNLDKAEPKVRLLEGVDLFPPINGSISAGFMSHKEHLGVDVLAPKNTAVKSVLDGIVVSSDWTLETGNTISIQHKENIISFYKHNSALLKKTGDIVKAGEAIAIIGNSGTLSDGPHLHFELWINGQPVNPVDYVSFN